MLALVDCNSCYASCEQIFRPDLRNRPVVVLSNNDGCIIARSKEAKTLGIPDLQSYFKIRHLLAKKGVQVFSANFRLYGDISNQVMATLKTFSPHVEQYSIDEMFLQLDGITEDYANYAETIKQRLWQNVRMPVGVGIAPTKTLAKLANHAAKKMKDNGVAVLDTPQKWQWLQKRLPVKKVWGIGSRLARRLDAMGIETAYQLATSKPRYLRQQFNVNVERTIRELNGEACINLEENAPPRKEIFITRTFGDATHSKSELLNHISRYAAAAAEKLRRQNSFTQTLYVFAQSSRFKANYYHPGISIQLPYPSSDTALIIHHAKQAMRKIYKKGVCFNKCGIGLLDLRERQFYQQDLFDPGQSLKTDKRLEICDQINRRFGRDTLVYGAEGLQGKWSMHQQMLSPAYTSSWQDLPRVKC